MYAMKCDLCNEVQVKEAAHEIRGRTYTEDGKTKFACIACDGKMKAAFEIGRKGLKDPLKKLAGLIQQRDAAVRESETKSAMADGSFLGAGDELKRRAASSKFPIVSSLDFEAQHKAMRLGMSQSDVPALLPPSKKKRKK